MFRLGPGHPQLLTGEFRLRPWGFSCIVRAYLPTFVHDVRVILTTVRVRVSLYIARPGCAATGCKETSLTPRRPPGAHLSQSLQSSARHFTTARNFFCYSSRQKWSVTSAKIWTNMLGCIFWNCQATLSEVDRGRGNSRRTCEVHWTSYLYGDRERATHPYTGCFSETFKIYLMLHAAQF